MVHQKKGQKMMPIMLPEEDFTYGQANRPSTPVKLVIGNCYAIEQDNRNATMYQREASYQPKNKTVAHKVQNIKFRQNLSCFVNKRCKKKNSLEANPSLRISSS